MPAPKVASIDFAPPADISSGDCELSVAFEDGGGILPVHSVGLEFLGSHDFSAGTVHYSLTVANGRGLIPDQVQNSNDTNRAKAVNARLSWSPAWQRELRLGVVYYHDTIPSDPGNPARSHELHQVIACAHLVYRGSLLGVLSEYFRVSNRNHAAAGQYRTAGGYAQLEWAWNSRWKNYFRYDRVNMDEADPYFSGLADRRLETLGLRWEAGAWTALKFELRSSRIADGDKQTIGALQAAFAF